MNLRRFTKTKGRSHKRTRQNLFPLFDKERGEDEVRFPRYSDGAVLDSPRRVYYN